MHCRSWFSFVAILTPSHSRPHAIARAMTTRQHAFGTIESFTVAGGDVGVSSRSTCDSPRTVGVQRVYLDDDGTYPNNAQYPTLLLKAVFDGTQDEGVRRITADGQWTSPWAWGIFEYHHYHSKAWELLLCVRGEASVQLGGPTGPTVTISRGDSVLIPPGVAHKQLNTKGGFTLLGAYPTREFDGSVDTLTGSPTNGQRQSIIDCYMPSTEPITGLNVKELCTAE